MVGGTAMDVAAEIEASPAILDTDHLDPRRVRRQLAAHLEDLARDVDRLRGDAGFQEALRNMARFWRYSFINQFLIMLQRPTATVIAGRRYWESVGRRVTPGERAIAVIAPSRKHGVLRFRDVPVYDVRQTRGRKLATVKLTLGGRTRHVRTLLRAAAELDVEVAFVPLPERVLGRSLGGRVEIQPSVRGRERAAVLAHELAHEVLHQAERKRAAEARRRPPERTHAECETEADATAYVVLRVLGILSRAPAYIAWQGGTGAGVLRSITRVQRAAQAILRASGVRQGRRRRRHPCPSLS
jgi:hypothetical protein